MTRSKCARKQETPIEMMRMLETLGLTISRRITPKRAKRPRKEH